MQDRYVGDIGDFAKFGLLLKARFSILLVLLVFTGLSCKDDEGITSSLPDEQILRLAYSSYKYPQGFYQEELTDCSLYYENTVSIRVMQERIAEWRELSTGDYSQARAWSDSSSAYSSVQRRIVAERETEKFFEFKRSDSSRWSILSRVHKASYLDRSIMDRFARGPILGVFKKRPMLAADVRELIEYIWFIENYEISGTKVLTVESGESESAFQILITEMNVSYGDWGMHDTITLFNSVYSVSKADGMITLNKEVQRVIEGHMH